MPHPAEAKWSDAEMLERRAHVKELHEAAVERARNKQAREICDEHGRWTGVWTERKPGADAAARWAGCLGFALLRLERELVERGLKEDPYEAAQKAKR